MDIRELVKKYNDEADNCLDNAWSRVCLELNIDPEKDGHKELYIAMCFGWLAACHFTDKHRGELHE